MSFTDINDKRNPADFKGFTFSKFKKTKVKKELIDCIVENKIEEACYWSAEFICAGHYLDLWECIIIYVSRYIHFGNPKLPIIIAKRFEDFKNIHSNGYIDNELLMRNNPKIREIFAQVIALLCNSRKKHVFQPVKLSKEGEFDMTRISSKLKAPNIGYVEGLFQTEDSKELFISVNELAYHVSIQSKNVVSACYWVEWIMEYESLCKRRKEKCICGRRTFAPILDIYQKDSIWLVWDVILKEVSRRKNMLTSKIVDSLLQMFSIRFTPGVKKRRRFVIYFAVALLCESVDYTIEMIENKDIIQNIVKKIDLVYRDVKKNEVAPETNYLFNGVAKSNLDKTLKRLEVIQSLSSRNC